MRFVSFLVIWCLTGMIASWLLGGVAAIYEHKCGYDSATVRKIDRELFDKWFLSISDKGWLSCIWFCWIVPLIFWPYHLIKVEAANTQTAYKIIDSQREREGS